MSLKELLLPVVSSFVRESIEVIEYVTELLFNTLIPKSHDVHMSLIHLKCKMEQLVKVLNIMIRQLE